jgi:hypothetical protein
MSSFIPSVVFAPNCRDRHWLKKQQMLLSRDTTAKRQRSFTHKLPLFLRITFYLYISIFYSTQKRLPGRKFLAAPGFSRGDDKNTSQISGEEQLLLV